MKDTVRSVDALFVGYENQENLGLRYVMAYLDAHGYRTALVPFNPASPQTVVEAAVGTRPALIGFSIIFQYTLHEFGDIMDKLRAAGVNAHFTCGGHYPSLRPGATLAALPCLDSVVRFEGELTALELLSRLSRAQEWPDIHGLAFRRDGRVIVTPPRRLVDDLDQFPWPHRSQIQQTTRGIPTAPILASRGCCFNCSFCSIRQFYGSAPGRLRRTRSPEDVVAEMEQLYQSHGIRLFLFQDDDFAAKSTAQRRWINRFLNALDRQGLSHEIGWKVSSRVDDVDLETMAACRERGLLVVYLGVESGNEAGLTTLNKHVHVEQNLEAMRALKALGIEFDMGFMLFDPDSTVASVRENIRFLREVARLEGPPISFVKMLPLAGTAIEARLKSEGRLTGTELRPDYDLGDVRLDHYALFVALQFSHRNSDANGVVERLRLAHFDRLVAQVFEHVPWSDDYGRELRTLIERANTSVLDALQDALDLVAGLPQARESVPLAWPRLAAIAASERASEAAVLSQLDQVLERYSPCLCRAFRAADGPADDAGVAA